MADDPRETIWEKWLNSNDKPIGDFAQMIFGFNSNSITLPDGGTIIRVERVSSDITIIFLVFKRRWVLEGNFKEFGEEKLPLAIRIDNCVIGGNTVFFIDPDNN